LPLRLGSAKLFFPSPPYISPRRANRACSYVITSNCPSQGAQGAGTKL
jgi:hypothetical protein